jgi:hypothetical protein
VSTERPALARPASSAPSGGSGRRAARAPHARSAPPCGRVGRGQGGRGGARGGRGWASARRSAGCKRTGRCGALVRADQRLVSPPGAGEHSAPPHRLRGRAHDYSEARDARDLSEEPRAENYGARCAAYHGVVAIGGVEDHHGEESYDPVDPIGPRGWPPVPSPTFSSRAPDEDIGRGGRGSARARANKGSECPRRLARWDPQRERGAPADGLAATAAAGCRQPGHETHCFSFSQLTWRLPNRSREGPYQYLATGLF